MLTVYTRKVLETAFFSDEKIFKVNQLYNSQNDRVYAPKSQLKRDVDPARLLRENAGFPKQVMVSVGISKAGKTSIFFVDQGAKVNADYYSNVLMKQQMIPEMDRLAKRQPYLFMQDGARAHTAKLTLNMMHQEKHLNLLEPKRWPPNSPDLNPVDFCIWGVLQRNVYRGRKITDLQVLQDAIIEEWDKIPQETINNCIDAFRPRLRRVIAEGGKHIERF